MPLRRTVFLFPALLVVLCATRVFAIEASVEEISGKKLHHAEAVRFTNPWCAGCAARSRWDFLKWQLSGNPYAKEKKKPVTFNVVRPDFKKLDASGKDYAVWLGHSTVLIKSNGKTILTDPVFWDVFFFIKRKTPLPIDPLGLPKIDFVLISHGHYDHLNTRTIEYLKERFDPVFITPLGYEEYFSSLGITKLTQLDWFENFEAGGIKITSLPVQHWSKRKLFGDNTMLWASYLMEAGNKKYYWVGDSGYYRGYKEIGEKFGPMDVFFVPIGAYEPRWFMKTYHMNPEEALQAAKDVSARTFIPIHWGTFDLTDEPLDFPIKRLKEIYEGKDNPVLKILDHGGAVIFE